ncbi:MAG: hypothetical protein JWN34_3579 [Bryobacterales bacterium]|nr:hypothetical protein [Bryobacterales bacterium]
MKNSFRLKGRAFALYCVLFILSSAFGFAQNRPSATSPSSVAAVTIKPEPGGQYAGLDRCRPCHPAEARQYSKTPHAALAVSGTAAANGGAVTGCETCHGPGKLHADAQEASKGDETKMAAAAKLIFAFKGNPTQNAARCQQCHATNKEQSKFEHSPHANHGVACGECHATHLVEAGRRPGQLAKNFAQSAFVSVPKLPEENRWLQSSLLRKPQPELCYGCHGNIQAQFALPTHHRVPEGAMKCTDCHSTHGTSNRATLRQVGWDTCATCHTEKRGPFVFEHSAVKVEGCSACHTPHGSVNRMLLTRREERFLCLQCHVNPAAANVPHSRLSFQTRSDCTRCHTSIHGSNFDPSFTH